MCMTKQDEEQKNPETTQGKGSVNMRTKSHVASSVLDRGNVAGVPQGEGLFFDQSYNRHVTGPETSEATDDNVLGAFGSVPKYRGTRYT